MLGSSRDIQWGLAKTWDDELANVGVLATVQYSGSRIIVSMPLVRPGSRAMASIDPDIFKITRQKLQEARQ
ncbi:hypothetical protein EYZ11_008782 [Aspergillus tanneri]|uniref:Uncharacterized protein n=1 Tax=Aspergillus tanneri TaxID=1220188 RepID=A0A4S3JF27_9EURO|nr:hypothetical protein EYZ11_008782 [Aspergillus tanneri]